jgi:signal transduction histidine kinase
MPDNSLGHQPNITGFNQKDTLFLEKLEMLERLAATIAHDVRNPLGTVNTSLFAIRSAIERSQPERVEKALNLAERNVKRCDSILTEFINITRMKELRIMPVNIDSWLKKIIEGLDLPQNIEIINALNCDRIFNIDPDQLSRAITNVIKNGYQAIKDAAPAVMRIIIESGTGDGSFFISVSDTGAGIPDEIITRVFEPLFSARHFGIGLGLTVAKEIVERHRGSITIQSKAGSGTKVTFNIPAV